MVTLDLKDYSLDVQKKIAEQTKSPGILEELSKEEYWRVRAAVAQNKYTAKETLEKLVWDEDDYVAERALKNPNTPTKVLEKIAEGEGERSISASFVLFMRGE